MGLLNVLRQRHPRFFLTRKEVATLSRRIDIFEKLTGCEVVFHFRKNLNENPLLEAERLFLKFGLHKTHHRAAILVVISLWDRKFAVWADENVHRKAGDVLWQKIGEKLSTNLKQGKRLLALASVLEAAEDVLKSEQPETLKRMEKTISNKPITDEDQ